jgi:hypothetical protein
MRAQTYRNQNEHNEYTDKKNEGRLGCQLHGCRIREVEDRETEKPCAYRQSNGLRHDSEIEGSRQFEMTV